MTFFSPKGEPLLDPYQLLNLEHSSASDEDIAKSFKKLMLQLHPDKQSADLSEEEREEISTKFHNVMDAKSFLLDGEHLAAKRAYDSKIARAKQAASLAAATAAVASAAVTVNPASASTQSPAAADSKQNTSTHHHAPNTKDASPSSTKSPSSGLGEEKQAKATEDKQPNKPTKATAASKTWKKASASAYAKKNIHVKQWGKVQRPSANKSGSSKTAAISRKDALSTKNNEGVTSKKKKDAIMKNKTHSRASARSNKFEDSCGDFSTTDDCTSDEEAKPQHTYSCGTSPQQKRSPTSNRPSVSSANKGGRPPFPKVSPINSGKGGNEPSSSSGAATSPAPAPAPESRAKRHTWHSSNNKKVGPSTRRRSGSDAADENNNTNNSKRKSEMKAAKRKSVEDKPPFPATTKSEDRPPTTPASGGAEFATFLPAVELLQKQYHCPLTKAVMVEPYSDFEGNSYERSAILKYLETNSVSPITSNPLYATHLSPNSALKEKIRYTMKLKDCLDTLQKRQPPPPQSSSTSPLQQHDEVKARKSNSFHQEAKAVPPPENLQVGVNNFIKDFNSNSPAISIKELDRTSQASFSYLGLKFRLEVPEGTVSDNIILTTWYDHGRKAASISSRVITYNATLQKMGLGGRLTYRKISGKYAFMLTKEMSPKSFTNKDMRYTIEYFMEMSIKLHNIMNPADMKTVGKVRLTNSQ